MHNNFRFYAIVALSLMGVAMISCDNTRQQSRTTGWDYNEPYNGGFYVADVPEEKIGPGLVPIEGGSFTMGASQEDVYYEWNNTARNVTVTTFYMDETEVSNIDYLEYIYWLTRIYGGKSYAVTTALPDTLVWRSQLAYNEPMVDVYFRHPAYHEYPVVGVSWDQAAAYSTWRSDRVNEIILINEGILKFDTAQTPMSHFSTESYLTGLYEGIVNEEYEDYQKIIETGFRNVKLEGGILLPQYRLPTEAEWEYAALALVGNTANGHVVERRVYPWNTDGLRTDDVDYYGSFVANFKRSSGDYMGIAGELNDGAAFPAPVASYWPNDYGLYNMAGNVSEWVMDTYRPLSSEDVADQNPFRGNVFMTRGVDTEGGVVVPQPESDEELLKRRNYRMTYNINRNDGDAASLVVYEYGVKTLISDNSRIYKGGSWADGPYYLSPSTRRFLDRDQSTATIGFRCAMDRVGSALTPRRK